MPRSSPHRPSRRDVLRLGGAGAGVLVAAPLAACGPEDAASGATGSAATADEVVVGTCVTLGSGNPLDEQYSTLQFNAYDALVRTFSGDAGPEPRLATSWTQVDDTTWRFTLRDGATFHDGTPVTAGDVVFSYTTLMEQKYGAYTTLATITGMTAPDDATVEVTTAAPDPLLMNRVALLFVVPEAHWTSVGGETGFIADPVGSGPYRVGDFDASSGYTLSAYDGFWGDAPATPTVQVTYFSDSTSLAAALQSGQVDVAHNLSSTEYTTLSADSSVTVTSVFGGNQNMLQLRAVDGPFADVRVRRAAIAAVDADALVTALTDGRGEKEDGQLPLREVTGYTASITRPAYDPDTARSLLAEAGADGAEITLAGMALYKPLLEAVAEQLTQVGFAPTIQALETSEWVQQFINGSDADVFYRGPSYTGVFDADRPFSFVSYGDSPAVVDSTWDALFAATRTETDTAARQAKLVACSEHLLDQAYVLWTYSTPSVGAVAEGVTGADFEQGLVLPLEALGRTA